MVRTVVAVLLAPAYIAALTILAEFLIDLSEGRTRRAGEAAIFLFSYIFALIPAALVMSILKRLDYLKLWHFAIAGFAAGVVCTSLFVSAAHRGYATESLAAFASEFIELSPLVVIGPIAGICIWVTSESHPLSFVSKKSRLKRTD